MVGCTLGACGLLLVAFLVHVSGHFHEVVPRFMPDDAFYYLKIASHIAAGHGSVFSPGEPTNGYHPLWMGFLVILRLVVGDDPYTFVLATLVLAACTHLIAVFCLWGALEALGFDAGHRALGVACFALAPWSLHLSLSGLETPLFFATLFCFYRYFATACAADVFDRRLQLQLGVTAALVMLARTDSVLITLPLFVWLLIVRGRAALRPLLHAGGVSTLLLAPWLAWNILRFGTPIQSSGVAMSYIGHWNAPPLADPAYVRRALAGMWVMVYRFFAEPLSPHDTYWLQKPHLVWLVQIGLLLAAGLFVYALWRRDRKRIPWPVLVPTLVLLAFYFFVRLYAQVWHMSTIVLLGVVFLLHLLRPLRIPIVAIGLVAAGLATLTILTSDAGYFTPQLGLIARAEALNDEPTTLRIGSTDCGYLGFFSRHVVVNLDGVVNNRALHYVEQGRLQTYIDAQHFDRVDIARARLSYYNRNLSPAPERP